MRGSKNSVAAFEITPSKGSPLYSKEGFGIMQIVDISAEIKHRTNLGFP